MSFFDEVETTVANTRFLQASTADDAPVILDFVDFDTLGEFADKILKQLSIEKVIIWNSIASYQFCKYLKENKVGGWKAYEACDTYGRLDKQNRQYEGRGVMEALCAFFQVELELPKEIKRPPPEHVPETTKSKKNEKKEEKKEEAEEKEPEPEEKITERLYDEATIGDTLKDINKKLHDGRYFPDSFNAIRPYFVAQFKGHYDFFLESKHFERYIQALNYMKKPQSMSNFMEYRTLGRGAFGAVSACQKNDTRAIFAIKKMNKKMVKKNKSEWVVLNEKIVLSKMRSPFVLSLKYAFHDKESLYLAFLMCTGGDLKFHLRHDNKLKCFSNARARHYAAEILLGLDHMHSMGIVYRDLKPDNILLNEEGRCVISDMGLCTKLPKPPKILKHLAGTAGYWAPEIVSKTGTYKQSDYWSFGVLLYEMLTGKRPACVCQNSDVEWSPFGLTAQHEKNAIKPNGVLKLNVHYPRQINAQARDLLSKLFNPDAKTRLGANGAQEIKDHPYFAAIDWERLIKLDLEPPYKPDANTVNAESIGDVGSFSKNQFKDIKLTPKDEQLYEKFDYFSQRDTEKELVKALYKMDNQPEGLGSSSTPAGCCVVC